MNALTPAGSSPAINSIEIAELVGKRHDNVKRTIETLVEQGVIVRPQIEDEPGTDAMGRPRPIQAFRFEGERGKRDSIVVVAQLSPEFTARLVDRWQQLEATLNARPAIPQSLPEALRLAADLAEQNAAQAALIHEQAPKVAALHRLSGADGAVCITTAAKDLQIRPKDLFQWLQANEWIYRRPGGSGWLAYQHRLQQGVLTHKVTTVHRGDGTEKQTEQVLVTPKGLVRLAELLQERAA